MIFNKFTELCSYHNPIKNIFLIPETFLVPVCSPLNMFFTFKLIEELESIRIKQRLLTFEVLCKHLSMMLFSQIVMSDSLQPYEL